MNKKEQETIKSIIEMLRSNDFELSAVSQREYNKYSVHILEKFLSEEENT